MALNPKLTYFSTASPVIASYNYGDIASGEGYIVFQCFAATSSTGISYHLTSSPLKSYPVETFKDRLNNTSQTVTINFDSNPFALARTLKGTAEISVQFGSQDGGVGSAVSYLTITLQHWDGTTATNMGSVVTDTLTNTSDGWENINSMLLVPLTETHFAIGEMIRVKVEHFQNSIGVSNKDFYLSHDPLNAVAPSSALAGETQFKINFPFKMDA